MFKDIHTVQTELPIFGYMGAFSATPKTQALRGFRR
jgi:hypothetical protein